jgi:hypothetical protein
MLLRQSAFWPSARLLVSFAIEVSVGRSRISCNNLRRMHGLFTAYYAANILVRAVKSSYILRNICGD